MNEAKVVAIYGKKGFLGGYRVWDEVLSRKNHEAIPFTE